MGLAALVRWSVLVATSACAFQVGATGGDAGGDAIDAAGDATDGGVATKPCAPLPAAVAPTVVTDVASLRTALASAAPNSTIVIADGKYDLSTTGGAITIATAGVTLRSQSGNAADAVLSGAGVTTPLVYVRATGVTLASITLAQAPGLALMVEPTVAGDVTGVTIFDVTFLDNASAMRIRPYQNLLTGPFADDGTIACSRFEIPATSSADLCGQSILAIAGDAARGWTVRDNRFERLSCTTGPRRNVSFRLGSRDTRIYRNLFVDSAMNIMLGSTTGANRGYLDALPAGCAAPDHWGGVVCNNVIAGLGVPSVPGNTDFEEGIALWNACEPWVLHNTIVSPAGVETYYDIEYRFAGTNAHLVNNLLKEAPGARDSAQADPAYLPSNALYAGVNDFVDAAGADLRLSATAMPPAGASIAGLGMCDTDFDGKPRNLATPTVGAFER